MSKKNLKDEMSFDVVPVLPWGISSKISDRKLPQK